MNLSETDIIVYYVIKGKKFDRTLYIPKQDLSFLDDHLPRGFQVVNMNM